MQRLEEERERASAMDEKTFKLPLSLSVGLTVLGSTAAFLTKVISSATIQTLLTIVIGIGLSYVLAAGFVALGALRTFPTYGYGTQFLLHQRENTETVLADAVPSIYSIVPPNDGSALRHGHHFEPVDFVIDHGRGHHDAYSAGSCQRTYARACGCRQRPRCHREELIESEPGWSGREAFVTMMQTADLGQGNDRSGPGRLNGSSIRGVLAERQVGP